MASRLVVGPVRESPRVAIAAVIRPPVVLHPQILKRALVATAAYRDSAQRIVGVLARDVPACRIHHRDGRTVAVKQRPFPHAFRARPPQGSHTQKLGGFLMQRDSIRTPLARVRAIKSIIEPIPSHSHAAESGPKKTSATNIAPITTPMTAWLILNAHPVLSGLCVVVARAT
jgi:hypothetical protein